VTIDTLRSNDFGNDDLACRIKDGAIDTINKSRHSAERSVEDVRPARDLIDEGDN